jgi:hypothetical protein
MNMRAKNLQAGSLAEPTEPVKGPKGTATDGLMGIAVAREESRRSNNRGSDRHRLTGETIRFTHQGREYEGELINLSGGGAMIGNPPRQLKLWDRVELHLGDHGTVECAVRWIRGGRIGLEFAHETQLNCSDDQRTSVLRETISRSFPDMKFKEAARESGAANRETGSDEHRGTPRHALIWWAVLHHDFRSTKVRIRNISESGAMLEYDKPAQVGAEPLLEFEGGASVAGTIAWAVGDHLGLRFHSDFKMEVLAKSAPQLTPAEWAPPAYLNKVEALGSPWDPRWNRLSVAQLEQELAGYLKY